MTQSLESMSPTFSYYKHNIGALFCQQTKIAQIIEAFKLKLIFCAYQADILTFLRRHFTFHKVGTKHFCHGELKASSFFLEHRID